MAPLSCRWLVFHLTFIVNFRNNRWRCCTAENSWLHNRDQRVIEIPQSLSEYEAFRKFVGNLNMRLSQLVCQLSKPLWMAGKMGHNWTHASIVCNCDAINRCWLKSIGDDGWESKRAGEGARAGLRELGIFTYLSWTESMDSRAVRETARLTDRRSAKEKRRVKRVRGDFFLG